MRNCSGRDLTAPAVFDVHRQPKRYAQVTNLPGAREPTHAIDFQVNQIHGIVMMCSEQGRQTVHAFVEHKRQIGMSAYRQTFFVGETRLFKVQKEFVFPRQVFDCVGHDQCLVLLPAGVGIGIQHFPGLHAGSNFVNAADIGQWVFADLNLKVAVALCAIFRNAGSHSVRIGACDYLVQFDFILLFAAEQGVHGEAGLFAEDIPAGHVYR